jgi:hypothetical protein
MVVPVQKLSAVLTNVGHVAAEGAFAAALKRAIPPDPPPKPPEPTTDKKKEPEIDAQPMDPSHPELWIGGPPSGGSDFVVPPPDDWQSNPGDVWVVPDPGITYA